ncbi:hypothetical protein TRICI_005395 [Trichomonascus ciferrii]|uniref:Uncharacterized protein n=1 Tax=Trichomonascus ciferrii TaxID=44093 RepID=A0A642UST7_9ASCO|nr:hypothetical protein TRICI_005395 [Trichomonascus ciferrii]
MAQVKANSSSAGGSGDGSGGGGSLNLTPASENAKGGLSSTISQHLSTRASVDSDSDYQGSATTPSGTPSRPLSRTSSSMSGVSTMATKDGVEGQRFKKFHEPTSYMNDDENMDRESITSQSTCSGYTEDNTPPPPNIPSAPPVTLNEKIRLLRTGSVSGKK